jgi:hypothetical protein
MAVVIALSLGFSLSGCESYGLGPAAISRDGSALLIVVCEDVSVVELYGTIETVKEGADWTPFLDVSGEANLEPGVQMGPDSLPEGLFGTWKAVKFDTLAAVDISFVGANENDSFLATFYNGGHLDVPDDKWLHTNGVETSLPCPKDFRP